MSKTNSKPAFNPETRSAARLAAVQALYEMEISGAEVDPVLIDFMSKRWQVPLEDEDGNEKEMIDPDKSFLAEIVRGVKKNASSIDEMIEGALDKSWTLSRLEVVLRCVLRAGIYELAHCPDTPKAVIINEYMDVANAFYTGSEPKMVNGVLDRLAKVLREAD